MKKPDTNVNVKDQANVQDPPFGDEVSKGQVALTEKAGLPVENDFDYGGHAGAGYEAMSKDDFAIPFLRILQSNSPQVEGNEQGIPGVKAGMIINNVTNEVFDGQTGIAYVPVASDHNFVRYIPRDAGGGMTGIFQVSDPYVQNAIATKIKEGGSAFGKVPCVEEYVDDQGKARRRDCELVETFYMFGLPITQDRLMRAVIGFSSTQIKRYKNWTTAAQSIVMRTPQGLITPPLFAHRWRLATIPDKNKKGSFYSWRIALDGVAAETCRLPKSAPEFKMAVEFHQMIRSGQAKVVYDQAPDREPGEEDDNSNFS